MNRMIIYILLGLLLLVTVAYFIMKPKKTVLDKYFITTESQSNEIIKNLNLDKPSEDASSILDTNKLSFPDIERDASNNEYKAAPDREWIIDVVQVNGGAFKREDFSKIFDYEWRNKYQSTLYGFSTEENRWTYADAGGTPEIYSKLQVAINVQGVFNDEIPNYAPEKLERYLKELEKRIKKYPTKLKIVPAEPISNAIVKAKKLVELYKAFNVDAIIVLQGDKPYKGVDAWDALQSLGLRWGDGDLFHWRNNKDYGHDQHFSVWTTTDPGYFLPEQIKNGSMNPNNLVFGFSIPRSADPKHIFERMLQAVKYCQKRLGGQILDKNGLALDEAKEMQHLTALLESMKSKGIIPGADKALSMY